MYDGSFESKLIFNTLFLLEVIRKLIAKLFVKFIHYILMINKLGVSLTQMGGAFDIRNNLFINIPVSYTHLDVYKRQRQGHPSVLQLAPSCVCGTPAYHDATCRTFC